MKEILENKYGHCHYCVCNDDNCSMIYNLYVEEEHREKGHAIELVQHCINKIREFGYKGDIGIVAEPEGNSISKESLKNFYNKLGLKVVDK